MSTVNFKKKSPATTKCQNSDVLRESENKLMGRVYQIHTRQSPIDEYSGTGFFIFPLVAFILAMILTFSFPHIRGILFDSQSKTQTTTKIRLNVPLQDAYKGNTLNARYSRNIQCPACDGTGAASSEHIHKCTSCHGRGKMKQSVRMGPFMYEEVVEFVFVNDTSTHK